MSGSTGRAEFSRAMPIGIFESDDKVVGERKSDYQPLRLNQIEIEESKTNRVLIRSESGSYFSSFTSMFTSSASMSRPAPRSLTRDIQPIATDLLSISQTRFGRAVLATTSLVTGSLSGRYFSSAQSHGSNSTSSQRKARLNEATEKMEKVLKLVSENSLLAEQLTRLGDSLFDLSAESVALSSQLLESGYAGPLLDASVRLIDELVVMVETGVKSLDSKKAIEVDQIEAFIEFVTVVMDGTRLALREHREDPERLMGLLCARITNWAAAHFSSEEASEILSSVVNTFSEGLGELPANRRRQVIAGADDFLRSLTMPETRDLVTNIASFAIGRAERMTNADWNGVTMMFRGLSNDMSARLMNLVADMFDGAPEAVRTQFMSRLVESMPEQALVNSAHRVAQTLVRPWVWTLFQCCTFCCLRQPSND